MQRVNEMQKDYDIPTALRRKKGYDDLDVNDFASNRELPFDDEKRDIMRKAPTKVRREKDIDFDLDELEPTPKKHSMEYDIRKVKPLSKMDRVSESKYFSESTEALDHILKRFPHEVRQLEKSGELDYDGPLYDALYDYYLQSGDMPYGVAKNREGSPYEWVLDKITEYLNGGDDDIGLDTALDDFGSDDLDSGKRDLSELSRLAGLSESKRVNECGEYGYDTATTQNRQSYVQVTTSYNSMDDQKSVTVSAMGDEADALLQMLRNAGIGVAGRESSDNTRAVVAVGNVEAYDAIAENKEKREPKYNNTPDENETGVEAIVQQGTDLNRPKKQYAGKARMGDNPMAATNESIVPRSFKTVYESIQKRDMRSATGKRTSRRK